MAIQEGTGTIIQVQQALLGDPDLPKRSILLTDGDRVVSAVQ